MPKKKDPELINRRNRDLVTEYNKLCDVKAGQVALYSHAYIMNELRNKFYIEEDTILKILRKHQ